MDRTIPLSKAAYYPTERISANKISISGFVTTDNMLQDKRGITTSTVLPAGTLIAFKKGDTLVANIRPYLKKIWFADRDGGCSADVLVFRTKDGYDPRFVFYSIFRDDFFGHVMKAPKGTKMPRGDKDHAMRFPIPNLRYLAQQKIAAVLSVLDDKIELNNKINAELEAMAKTLYDYWFVQFDFPNVAGKPYKSSGGAMVWNEQLKREIPEGWEVMKLGEIANITMGQSPEGVSFNDIGEGVIFYQGSTDFGWRFPTIRQYTKKPTRFAKTGDILLSVRAPVGAYNIANEDCCIGRGLAALHSKHGFNSFLLNLMSFFKKRFDNINSVGTTFGSITKDDLHSLILVYPPKSLLSKFEKVASAFDKQIFNLSLQNQTLSTLRDWLLPMLMNGQVSVGVAYEKLAAALSVAAEGEANYQTFKKV